LPYARDTTDKCRHSFPQISFYAVVSGCSEICVSVEGVGTYCLNKRSYTWSEVGKWTLPFYGKVEYVPELKLWFGISAGDQTTLAAADLSAMDSQPQLRGRCRWKESRSLTCPSNEGMRGFSAHRSGVFNTRTPKDDFGDESTDRNLVVVTGVEVAPHVHDGDGDGGGNANADSGSGRVELTMVNHRSRCY
ncbi:hypothetical protein BAE44_0011693, partial [Dichanthelium oligosanthes]